MTVNKESRIKCGECPFAQFKDVFYSKCTLSGMIRARNKACSLHVDPLVIGGDKM